MHDLSVDFRSAESGRLWMNVLNQIEKGEMPPKDETQPDEKVRRHLVAEIKEQFRLAGNPVELIRSAPKFGNYVNHQELFSGNHKGPSYSRPRIWRISPYIDGQSSPFGLSQEEGFKDYAHMWSLDKPTMELLLVKASAAVKRQIGPSETELKQQDEIWKNHILNSRRKLQLDVKTQQERVARDPNNEGHKKRLEALEKQLKRNESTDFQKDRKRPYNKLGGLKKNVFWRIAFGDAMPPKKDINDAVTKQLKVALRREPSQDDIEKMASRLEKSIADFGNLTGMELTMTSILLMPEAIYRMELGLGKKMPDGRRMLNQAEVAYALGYALTDGGPDKEIMKDLAARKLSDPKVIKGHVERIYDSAISGTTKRKGKAERVLRFFQEYFEYQGATDVFKDGTRHPGHDL